MYSTLVCFVVFYSNCTQCANILGVFPFPSLSHQIVFQAIWRELSLRGHNVVVVTPDPLNDQSLTNLTEVNVRHAYKVWEEISAQNTGAKDANVFRNLVVTLRLLDTIVERVLNTTQFQKLSSDKDKKFDLILVECFFPILHILGTRFEAPVVGVSSLGVTIPQYDVVGTPNQPVLYPDLYLGFSGTKISKWQKVKSFLFTIWSVYYYYYCAAAKSHKMGMKYFGDKIPYVGSLEKNITLLYLSDNNLLFSPRAQVPATIHLGQMHIKSIQPLPKDLQEILDGATEGVVYFSLGSNVKSVDLDENFKKIIIQALSELPYKIIWKWESDFFPNKPPNVIIRKWLPQQDLLAHPNIRVFVTQGGMQSTEEAIVREVPMVGLPFIYDQPMNIEKMASIGIGIALDPMTVTKDQLKNSIIEVSENNNYKIRIKEVRRLLFDKDIKSIENAVWWSEYVIRHKGARYFRSPSADISWFQYLMIDVFIIFGVILVVITYGSYKIVKLVFNK